MKQILILAAFALTAITTNAGAASYICDHRGFSELTFSLEIQNKSELNQIVVTKGTGRGDTLDLPVGTTFQLAPDNAHRASIDWSHYRGRTSDRQIQISVSHQPFVGVTNSTLVNAFVSLPGYENQFISIQLACVPSACSKELKSE